MTRSDIQVIIRRSSITILTKYNQITFSPSGKAIAMFSTVQFTKNMLSELENSKIIEIERYTNSDDWCTVKIRKKFGFTNDALTNLLVYILEKYKL